MPSTINLTKAPRRDLCVFYVLDTSGSMKGTPIATLNRAMIETVDILKQRAKSNADALLKIAVLEFNTECAWLQEKGPEEMQHFYWEDLNAGGLTEMGAALEELDSKLSRNAFLKSNTGAFLPVIVFMTDGFATDDYRKALMHIRQNKWFTHAMKIGFAVGDEADAGMIAEIVGNCEAVIKTDDLELFAKLIKFASVTATMMSSTSRTSDAIVTGKDVIAQVISQGATSENVVPTDISYTPEPAQTDNEEFEFFDDNFD